MGEGSDKKLRFTFAVDEASLQKARQAVREFTSEVSKLTETMNRVGGGLGASLFGGATARGGLRPGATGFAAQQSSVKTGSGGVTDSLTQSLVSNKNLLKGVASESKDTMRAMTDALRSGIDQQRQKVDQLRGSLEQLVKRYDQLKGMQVGGATIDHPEIAAERLAVQQRIVSAGGQLGRAREDLGKLQQMQKPEGFLSKMMSGQGVMQALGVAGPVAAIVGAAQYAKNTAVDVIAAGAHQRLNAAWDPLTYGARQGGALGDFGNQLRYGDLARSVAYLLDGSEGNKQLRDSHAAFKEALSSGDKAEVAAAADTLQKVLVKSEKDIRKFAGL